MTQEEKQLLLKDLCARLPYGVYAKLPNHKLVEHTYFLESINMRNGWTEGVLECAGRKQIYSAEVEDVKPYLSPMSSMTEEDIQGMFNSYYFKCNNQGIMLPCRGISELLIEYHKCYMPIDWLNKHHFDYRGLIEKGLALEASEGMYNRREITMATIKTTSVSAHDTYSCARPKNIETMDCCKTCTSRQPNINCKFLKIETVYIKD